jgi:selenocysteine-specific elongation factor
MTVIATAGHVDHGKSSLVRALTGTDPDRLSEEKQRGMTIDLGFAHTTTSDGVTLSFIDVPGHVDFIRNMIAGVSHVGVVLLVVDAAEGWMPQTTEHCDVVSLLGSRRFVVAITKSDRVDAARIHKVEKDVRARLTHRGIDLVDVVAISVNSSHGIEQLRNLLAVTVADATLNVEKQRTRLFIDRVFSMTGSGTVITGTLQGHIDVDDRMSIVGNGVEVRVRGIQTHGQAVNSVDGPARVALNVTGVGSNEISRGDALVRSEEWNPTTSFDASLEVLSSLGHNVSKRGQFILHVGTSDQEVQLRVLGADSITPGNNDLIRLTFQHALPLLPGDRFVLRETGRSETVGGGTVLDVHPVAPVTKARPDGTVQTYLSERGWVLVSTVWRDTGQHVGAVVGEWVASDAVVADTRHHLQVMLDESPEGVDVSILQPWEKLLIHNIEGVIISHGVARRGQLLSPDEQRIATLIRNGGRTGVDTTTLARDVMRRLVQMGTVYEHDGIAFHVDVLEDLRDVLTELWRQFPAGFTMAALRDIAGLTRKHAVPLGTVLDKYGLTKRVGDVRLPASRYER